jgi:hypothetical protein
MAIAREDERRGIKAFDMVFHVHSSMRVVLGAAL